MTLCMAAKAHDYEKNIQVLVLGADRRAETFWAGGDVAYKLGWALWNCPALIAGEISKAEDFLATSREYFEQSDDELTEENIFDKFNEVSSAHKKKLCERLVQQRLGISFERFLTRGEVEVPSEARSRLFYELEQLEFGCEVIVCGFIGKWAFIVEIDKHGEVTLHQNFAAIGTGSIIAKSTLYQRKQYGTIPVNETLYHLYEASKLAHMTAPAVGRVPFFHVVQPARARDKRIIGKITEGPCLEALERVFQEAGPKPVGTVPEFDESCFYSLNGPDDTQDRQAPAGRAAKQLPAAKKKRGQPSKRKKSKGQP